MTEIITAEEFSLLRYDLPEVGQFSELVAGSLNTYQPVDLIHGDVVFNLTKLLGNHLQTAEMGYACYEQGLLLARNPDTVRIPAVSLFITGERFAQSDRDFSELAPDMVVEVASTNDRRREMTLRIDEYLNWGVQLVWVIDPHEQELHVHSTTGEKQRRGSHQSATAAPILPDFLIRVKELFTEPGWIH